MVKKFVPFKLGCDPELFLADYEGKLRASCGLIGGTKEAPQPIPQLGDGYAVQEDNVAIEFNIPPAGSMREFVSSVARIMKVLGDGVNTGLNFHIVDISAAEFPKEELESPAAQAFGCDPDYDAWTGEQNPKPKAKSELLRSAGGHIHIGYDKRAVEPRRVIKCLDMTQGVTSILMDHNGEKRRELYGKRGCYREKPYGVEYRTLSNFWVFNPKYTEWAWKTAAQAMDWAANDFNIDSYDKDIANAINKNDRASASLMVRELGLEVLYV